jgi:hypothetical protein
MRRTFELSGCCREELEFTVPIHSGPLERIVRPQTQVTPASQEKQGRPDGNEEP